MPIRKVFLLSLLLLQQLQVLADSASAENFKTEEFYASGARDIINEDDTYVLGKIK